MRISDWSSDVCSSDLLPAPVPPTFQNERRSARWRVHQSPAAENGLWFPHDPRRQAPSTAPPVRPAASYGGPHRDHGGGARAAADGMPEAHGRNLSGPPPAGQREALTQKQREKPWGRKSSPTIPQKPPTTRNSS